VPDFPAAPGDGCGDLKVILPERAGDANQENNMICITG
jgi:hypothetical protein